MRVLLAALAALALAACGRAAGTHHAGSGATSPEVSTGARTREGGPSTGVPALDHIAVVVMENHEYGELIGQRAAPWITSQAHRFGLASRYYAITHPSLPNYLALTGGSTFGIDEDCTDCHVDQQSLTDQLDAAGVSWKAYMESMPSPCYQPTSSEPYNERYAKGHNPFFYYDGIRDGPDCQNVVPYTQLEQDLASPDDLPRFIWITPDLCHDMHNCAIATGDRWLREQLPPLIEAMGPDSALFLTWDEGASERGCCGVAAGGRVPLVVLGSAAARHTVTTKPLDHYALLRTIQEAFGLPPLRRSSAAGDLAPLLR